VIFDPNRKETISVGNPKTHHMRVDYSAYEGFEVQGFTETVLSRGRVVIEGTARSPRAAERFIKRAKPGELLR
jgi:dihydropyrimidinase